MRLSEVIGAASRTAVARWVSSVMLLILISALTLATAATLGQALVAHEQVVAQLESAGVRKILLQDRQQRGFLQHPLVQSLASLNTLEVAYGLTTPRDVHNGAFAGGGPTAPMWGVIGELGDLVELTAGRWPNEGEALISQSLTTAMGFDQPFGSVSGVSVVGSFTPRDGFETYAAGILHLANEESATEVVLITAEAEYVEQTLVAALRIVDQPPSDLGVQSPQSVANIRAGIMGQLDRTSKQQATFLVVIGMVLVSAVAFGDVLLNRQDIGRRRALGASRGIITTYVTTRVALPALAGAGLSGVVLTIAGIVGWLPLPADFILAICTLNLLAMVLAAIPPAAAASYQDPVRVLRVA